MVDKINVSQPGATSGEGEESNAPQYVTQEQLNQAINGFRKSFRKDFESALDAKLAAFAPKEETEMPPAPKPTLKGLDSEKEDMKKQLKLLMDEKLQREAELAEQRLQTSLRDTLTKHGVDPRHVDHAIAFVQHGKLVKYDDDGNLVMKVNQIDMPLTDAVNHWVKTDEAKLYLAPRGTQGSGQRGSVRAPDTNASAQPTVTRDTIGDMLMGELLKQ